MPAFLALRSVSARHRRIPPVIYKLRRSPGLDRSHYPVESRNPEMSCAVSRGFSTIGKCPASSMAANRAPRIRREASSADCQENWTSWRPDRMSVGDRIRGKSSCTEASRRLNANPVAMNARRRARGIHAAKIAGVDEGRDGLAIRREGAVFSREQGAEALTRQVGRNPRMASADHPSNAEPNLRPGGPPVEQKDGKSARGAAL